MAYPAGARFAIPRCLTLLLLAATLSCEHSQPFTEPTFPPLGPFSTAADAQLTFNPDADYWPTFSEDGRSLLYQYSTGRPDGSRCLGLLPPAGGTWIWTFCDPRTLPVDSTRSYSAFALGDDGRLLYMEATSRLLGPEPFVETLWLADTAHPLARRALLTLPLAVHDSVVDWLTDAVWTGPATFVALANHLVAAAKAALDTVFVGQFVVHGTISMNGAALTAIVGTEGADGYSLASGGSTVVFWRLNSGTIWQAPVGGGPPDSVATVPINGIAAAIHGISCQGSTCVVATDQEELIDDQLVPGFFIGLLAENGVLYQVGLADHSVVVREGARQTNPDDGRGWFTPRIVPGSGDVVLQVGGSPGMQVLSQQPGADLHRFAAIVH
jgi:hypothetical protein